MMRKVRLLLELGKPMILVLICLLTLGGAALSPNFLSPDFPRTRLGGTALFTWLAELVPRAFSPPMWSLAHALGAALVVGLLWLGTALINDMADRVIDTISDPNRPLPRQRIRPSEVLRWALGMEAVAFGLVLLAGTRLALLFTLVGAGLGNAYSLPPFRLRRNGVVASLIIGAGGFMAVTGGMMAQGPVPEVGLLPALALGLLALAISMVKDFRDVDGDRSDGVRTLPVLLGVQRAALINLACLTAAYLLALWILMQRIGMQTLAHAALIGLAAANLFVVGRLLDNPGPDYAHKAYRRAVIIFMGVILVFVGAQTL